jgi:hypothetical protein
VSPIVWGRDHLVKPREREVHLKTILVALVNGRLNQSEELLETFSATQLGFNLL